MPSNVSRRSTASSLRTAPGSRAATGDRPQQDRPACGPAVLRAQGRTDRACVPRLVRDGRRYRRAEACAVRALSAAGSLRSPREDGLVDFLVYRPRSSGRRFRILRTDSGFRISGEVPDGRGRARSCAEGGGGAQRRRGRSRRRGPGGPVTGLLGGTFNPPHNGHIALADAARGHFDLDELAILVAVNPGHKEVQLGAESRAEARACRVPRLRGRARSPRAHRRPAEGRTLERSALPHRRRPVRRVPHVEGSGRGDRARPHRCRHASRLPAPAARQRSRPALAPGAGGALRHRAACPSRRGTSATGSPAESRSTGSCRRTWRR